MKRIRPLAVVGLLFLLGITTAASTTLYYLLYGGLMPLIIGALALSVVALSLLYGEQQLDKGDGCPS